MKAFVTLGGVLSVCFTVTLHERCLERVAIGASLLLSSAPPLHLLRLCRISLLFFRFSPFPTFITPVFFPHSMNPLSCFSPLPLLSSIQPFIFLSDPPSAFPSPSFFLLSPFRFFYLPHTNSHIKSAGRGSGLCCPVRICGWRLGQELKGDYRSREGGNV